MCRLDMLFRDSPLSQRKTTQTTDFFSSDRVCDDKRARLEKKKKNQLFFFKVCHESSNPLLEDFSRARLFLYPVLWHLLLPSSSRNELILERRGLNVHIYVNVNSSIFVLLFLQRSVPATTFPLTHLLILPLPKGNRATLFKILESCIN